MHREKYVGLLLFCLLLSACAGGTQAVSGSTVQPMGNASAGENLFHQSMIGSAPGCSTCHSIEPDQVIVGPSLAGVATRAVSRVKGQTAEEYLRNSILDPNVYIVDGFSPNTMYQNYKDALSDQQVNDLVAYLLTLK